MVGKLQCRFTCRRYTAGILSIRGKTQVNQSADLLVGEFCYVLKVITITSMKVFNLNHLTKRRK